MSGERSALVPPFRLVSSREGSTPYKLLGAAATVVAHGAVLVALLFGVTIAVPSVAEKPMMVAIKTIKPELPKVQAVPIPKLAMPYMPTMPVPQIEIATPPSPAAIQAVLPGAVASVAKSTQVTASIKAPQGEGRDDYLARLLAHLNRYKRYPPAARSARIEGVVVIRFVMDRRGNVSMREVVTSSGRPVLDREALTLTDRAQPLPSVPSEMDGDRLDLQVPIHFSLR